jgi:peptide/nickel transport system permease protein
VISASPAPLTSRSPGAGVRRWFADRPLLRFVIRRVISGLVTLWIVTLLIFVSVQLLPGNVASVVLGQHATVARVDALDASLHLNRSVVARYGDFLGGLVTGHFGDSTAALAQGEKLPVWTLIRDPLRNSFILAAITMLLFIPLCMCLALVGAFWARGGLDRLVSLVALAIGAMPEFLIGTVLILIFFSELNLLPPVVQFSATQSPLSKPTSLILPVATLLLVSAAFGMRLLRASIVDVLQQDFISMARLNGQPEGRVVRYALRNALGPFVQVCAQMVQYLVGGIIIVESVFNYPGIGSKLVQAISDRDIQVVGVIAAMLAAVYIMVNIVADVLVVLLVPRLRTTV